MFGSCDILEGYALAVLPTLPEASVQCCVTSPPYWGLRDYGLPPIAWEAVEYAPMPGLAPVSVPAVEACWGLERTPEEFIAHCVAVFRAVRRVLRDDGTCWVNMGDSYTSGGRSTRDPGQSKKHPAFTGDDNRTTTDRAADPCGLKPKDLIGIPWRLAFALQADGWYLRSDIIWAKPNPMPESVLDRPTKAHEYLFLLTRSERYFYDADAIRLPPSGISGGACFGGPMKDEKAAAKVGASLRTQHRAATVEDRERYMATGANARSVWTIPTQAFPDAHFATFPETLPEKCILAGTSERGCCLMCGKAWRRDTETTYGKSPAHGDRSQMGKTGSPHGMTGMPRVRRIDTTVGWSPACECGAEPVPCTVLDICAGSGTTLMVAAKHGRNAIGIEPNPEYIRMARKRIAKGLRPGTFRDESKAEAGGLFVEQAS